MIVDCFQLDNALNHVAAVAIVPFSISKRKNVGANSFLFLLLSFKSCMYMSLLCCLECLKWTTIWISLLLFFFYLALNQMINLEHFNVNQLNFVELIEVVLIGKWICVWMYKWRVNWTRKTWNQKKKTNNNKSKWKVTHTQEF